MKFVFFQSYQTSDSISFKNQQKFRDKNLMESRKKREAHEISLTEDDKTQKYICFAAKRKGRKYKKQKGR